MTYLATKPPTPVTDQVTIHQEVFIDEQPDIDYPAISFVPVEAGLSMMMANE